MPLDHTLFQQLSPYLDEALELDPEAREPWLRTLEQTQAKIAREVRELLGLLGAVQASAFLEQSLVSETDSAVGEKIGAYTIERLLGRGGMGSVWLGKRSDDKFEGRAAIKLLDRRGLGRFAAEQIRREANFLARLSHAHIARLFDAGVRESGQPYLILEYIEGEPIDLYCKSHALPLDARLALFLDVLDAVAYAQAQLIVHGDLKPSNVLVSREGGVKLLDFGVASLRSEVPIEQPQGGPRALTPGYAAPEQVRGEALSAAADVYSLGILLHILLTNRHPFGSSTSTSTQLVRAALTEEPAAASAQMTDSAERQRVRGDLDAMIARALQRDPSQRYATAAEFAADVRRFIGNFPVHAHRATRWYVAQKFAKRHLGGVLAALLILIVLISTSAITTKQMFEARKQRDFAFGQLERAESLNELNNYVLTDAAPAGKPFTVNDLLGRAAHLLERQQTNSVDRAALLTSIGQQYDTQDVDKEALKYLTKAYQLSQTIADPSVRARAACSYGRALAKNDSSARPEALFAEGLHDLPSDTQFALDRSYCWSSGSGIALDRGDATVGIERSQQALQALAQVPFDHTMTELRAQANLAEAYREGGKYHQAIATFERLWPRLVAQGRDDTATAGTWLNNWGVAYSQLGRPIDAEKLLRRSMAIHRVDASDEGLSPMLMTNYAQELLDLNRLEEAQDYAERALKSATLAGDEVVINQTLLRLARIYRAQHQFAHSLEKLDEVEPRLHQALPPGHYVFAALAVERARTLELKGDNLRALNLANEGIRMCEESSKHGQACEQYLPSMLRRKASIEATLKIFPSAETDARRALNLLIHEAPAGEVSEMIGEAYLTLAICLKDDNHTADARAMAQLAERQLQETIGADHPDTRSARELANL